MLLTFLSFFAIATQKINIENKYSDAPWKINSDRKFLRNENTNSQFHNEDFTTLNDKQIIIPYLKAKLNKSFWKITTSQDKSNKYFTTINLGKKESIKSISIPSKLINKNKFDFLYSDFFSDIPQNAKICKFSIFEDNQISYINLTQEITAQFVTLFSEKSINLTSSSLFNIYDEFITLNNNYITLTDLKSYIKAQINEKIPFHLESHQKHEKRSDIAETVKNTLNKRTLTKSIDNQNNDKTMSIQKVEHDHFIHNLNEKRSNSKQIKNENETLILQNEFISQVFSISGNKLKTKSFTNTKAQPEVELSLNDDSEEFIFSIDFGTGTATEIKSSSFDLDKYNKIDSESSEKVTFTYKPYLTNSVEFKVIIDYELFKGKNYIEKEIKISVPDDKKDIKFNYIDLVHFSISDLIKEKSWTHPSIVSDRKDILSEYIIALGQPVYMNTFFTGCRFPLTDNQMVDNVIYNRYHSGKKFSQLKTENGFYNCWKTVIGASKSSKVRDIQKDLFAYIEDISHTKVKFRKMFNTWYDLMLTVNETNTLNSFYNIEKICTQYGISPFDSYVINDGWNNYNFDSTSYPVHDVLNSGNSYNKEGFWSINDKFPNGFSKHSNWTQKVSSKFGIWLGPRGGYNYNSQFARMIESAGYGFYNSESDDIDVSSTKYTEKLTDYLVNLIKEYKVNYLKLDGFLFKPCSNENHDHIVGGQDGVYQYTDYWERYIDSFEKLRETAKNNGIEDLCISLIHYVNPSPFHLQWVNSVWIQFSDEIGEKTLTSSDSYFDKILNYRDDTIHEFYNKHEFQFPQYALYLNEPIFGKKAPHYDQMLNSDELKMYLFMCGMKGTSIFELYYSDWMLDQNCNWIVNDYAINYIEKRFDVLKNSIKITINDVYGYSAWSNDRGTIALRNPTDQARDIKFNLNTDIGVPENIPTVYRNAILKYKTTDYAGNTKSQKYNDEISMKLQPHEVRIIDFNPTAIKNAIEVDTIKVINNVQIRVRFSRPFLDIFQFDSEIENKFRYRKRSDTKSIELFYLDFFDPKTYYDYYFFITEDNDPDFKTNGIRIQFNYNQGNIIFYVSDPIGPITTKQNFDYKKKVDSFTIQFTIGELLSDEDQVLFKDIKTKYSIEIINKGYIKFTVNDVSVTSNEKISKTRETNVTCIRERNTMVKIYINGEISNSNYKQSQSEIIELNSFEVYPSNVIFNTIIVYSDAMFYKEVSNSNKGMLRTSTCIASGDYTNLNSIVDNNDNTYVITEDIKDERQRVFVRFDRDVYVDHIGYVPYDSKTDIENYLINTGTMEEDLLAPIVGTFVQEKGMKVAHIGKVLETFVLRRYETNFTQISCKHLYFFGKEIIKSDIIPDATKTPIASKVPTINFTNIQSVSLNPSDYESSSLPNQSVDNSNNNDKTHKYLMIAIIVSVSAVVLIIVIIIVFVCLMKKQKKESQTFTESLITNELI